MSDLSFPQNDGYVGAKSVTDGLQNFNTISFITQQILAGMATSMLVLVKTVSPGAGLLPGRVTVQPMVNQVDGYGNAVPHGEIFDIPYQRVQGGSNAIIMDPAAGDIGLAVFASRDISSVKANKAVSNPGSRRVFDMADGLYFGGFLNGAPTQFVEFLPNGGGIIVTSPATVTVNAPTSIFNGDVHATGAVIAGYGGADQVGLQTHTHAQAPDSHGDTEQPTNAPTAGT